MRLLTIGDGLVAQIPSLLLSTSAAIMVTRVTSSQDMGGQIIQQMFSAPKALGIAAGILILLGLIPGMPHVAFLGLGLMAAAAAWFIWKKQQQTVEDEGGFVGRGGMAGGAARQGRRDFSGSSGRRWPGTAGAGGNPELGWDDVATVDIVGLEVGYRLIPLVDKSQGGQLLSRIKGFVRSSPRIWAS